MANQESERVLERRRSRRVTPRGDQHTTPLQGTQSRSGIPAQSTDLSATTERGLNNESLHQLGQTGYVFYSKLPAIPISQFLERLGRVRRQRNGRDYYTVQAGQP